MYIWQSLWHFVARQCSSDWAHSGDKTSGYLLMGSNRNCKMFLLYTTHIYMLFGSGCACFLWGLGYWILNTDSRLWEKVV